MYHKIGNKNTFIYHATKKLIGLKCINLQRLMLLQDHWEVDVHAVEQWVEHQEMDIEMSVTEQVVQDFE